MGMHRPLLTRWDIQRFAVYEVYAVGVAVLVHGLLWYAVFYGGLVALAWTARRHVRRHPKLGDLAPEGSAPWWLTLPVGIAVIAGVLTVVDRAGAGHGLGWLMAALGMYLLADQAMDRWWTDRQTASVNQAGA